MLGWPLIAVGRYIDRGCAWKGQPHWCPGNKVSFYVILFLDLHTAPTGGAVQRKGGRNVNQKKYIPWWLNAPHSQRNLEVGQKRIKVWDVTPSGENGIDGMLLQKESMASFFLFLMPHFSGYSCCTYPSSRSMFNVLVSTIMCRISILCTQWYCCSCRSTIPYSNACGFGKARVYKCQEQKRCVVVVESKWREARSGFCCRR